MHMRSIRRCEIVSNLMGKDGKILFDMEHMKKVLSEKSCIREFSYIIHDKDTYTEEEEKRNPEHKCGELKAPHIHLLLRFEEKQPQKLEYVAQWFGIGENYVNKIQGRWEDACLYQTHINASDKYQYSPEEVVCNFDYDALLKKEAGKRNVTEIIKNILNGNIREYNKTLEIDNTLLVTHARLFNEAFKVRAEHLQATIKDRNTECIFITGGSSVGKTTFAKRIVREKNLHVFISSGSNDILDGYAQEPAIILDDIRPSSMGLSDLLKMLDNHTASSTKSRYKNKFLNCELIILTTVLDIDSFYNNVFAEHDEPIIQLKRRCGTYIQMFKEKICISLWDNKELRYTDPVIYKNNIIDDFMQENSKNIHDVKEHISELIPFLEIKEEPEFEQVSKEEQCYMPFD